MANQPTVRELPNGRFSITDAQGNVTDYASRAEAEAALQNMTSKSGSDADRPQTQRPDPSRGQS